MPAGAIPTLVHVDPGVLLVDSNIRSALSLDGDFVASLREHGVLQPVIVVRTERGGLRVRAGNRRTVGAIEAGLPEIPAVVYDVVDEDSERLVEQLVENTQRRGLDIADTIAAVEQLALLGLPAATIARRTALAKATVEQALTAAGSDYARATVTDHDTLTLEHAAWLAEFDDTPTLRDQLAADFTGDTGHDRHQVERARTVHAREKARASLLAALAAEHPDATAIVEYRHDDAAEFLDWLKPAISPDEHTGCPGHAYYVIDEPDWQSDGPDTIHHDGQRFRVCWLCTQPSLHGHTTVGASHEEQEGDDTAAAAQRVEQRRRTIALNRAGDAALTVRREWLTDFTRRKSPPKDAPAFLWAGLARHHDAAVDDAGAGMAYVTTTLHMPDPKSAAFDTWLAGQPSTLLSHLCLCARLWAYEYRVTRDVWRADPRTTGFYLRTLEAWGYTLSDVEKVAAGDLTEQQAHDALKAGADDAQ